MKTDIRALNLTQYIMMNVLNWDRMEEEDAYLGLSFEG